MFTPEMYGLRNCRSFTLNITRWLYASVTRSFRYLCSSLTFGIKPHGQGKGKGTVHPRADHECPEG